MRYPYGYHSLIRKCVFITMIACNNSTNNYGDVTSIDNSFGEGGSCSGGNRILAINTFVEIFYIHHLPPTRIETCLQDMLYVFSILSFSGY